MRNVGDTTATELATYVVEKGKPLRTVAYRVGTGPIEGEAAMYVRKSEIIATLRSRGLSTRADWVDRELPELVDAYKHSGLLATLQINPADLSPVAVPTPSD